MKMRTIMSEIKNLIKTILKFYVDKNDYEQTILKAFLKEFEFTTQIVGVRSRKAPTKIKRRIVYESIEKTLQFTKRNDARRNDVFKVLVKFGAIPTAANGYYFFRGIKYKSQ